MTEGYTHTLPELADADSLLGLLQRGRGKGYLMALDTPPEKVHPLLLECVLNDPRLDRSIEDRAEYYAALIAATEMDLGPLHVDLRKNDVRDSPCTCCLGLILCTLGCLVDGWHNEVALEILCDYVSFGRKWILLAQILADSEMPDTLKRIGDILVRRMQDDVNAQKEFAETVQSDWPWYCKREENREALGLLLPVCEPWKTLCTKNPELARYFGSLGIDYDHPSPPPKEMTETQVQGLSLEEAFTLVDESNRARFGRFLPEKVSLEDEAYLLQQLSSDNRCRVMLAFRGLGAIGTPNAFAAVKSYIEGAENADRSVRRYAYLAIEAMPAELTLETARLWFRSGKNHLHIPAGGILEQHATIEDVPMLAEALRDPNTLACDDFRLMDTLRALAQFDGIGPIPELETVFCEVRNCRRRFDAAVAMEITAPVHFQHNYAFECLWDCHCETQILGCQTVSLTIPGALERLRELAADENEDEDVREAAQRRLEDF